MKEKLTETLKKKPKKRQEKKADEKAKTLESTYAVQKGSWRSSVAIRLTAMILALVSGIFVAATAVVTIGFTVSEGGALDGSRAQIEKALDKELLRAYAYQMANEVSGRNKKQSEQDVLKQFEGGNIEYSLAKYETKTKKTEVVATNSQTKLSKDSALTWLKFIDGDAFHTQDSPSFWGTLYGRGYYQSQNGIRHRNADVEYFIYDNGTFYCFADNVLIRMNSFVLKTVPDHQRVLQAGTEYVYRENGENGGYYDSDDGTLLKTSTLERYMDSSDLVFLFDWEVQASCSYSKAYGIYQIAKESLKIGYPDRKVYKWLDYTFYKKSSETNDEMISYDAEDGEATTEYTLYLTVPESLTGEACTWQSLLPEEQGTTTLLGGKTQYFQKAHVLSQIIVNIRKNCGWWLILSGVVWIFSMIVLLCTAGWKKGETRVQLRWNDRIWFGVYALAVGCICAFLGVCSVLFLERYLDKGAAIPFYLAFILIFVLVMEWLVYEFCMSIVVRIKAKKFLQYTVLFAILRPLGKAKKELSRELSEMKSAAQKNMSMIVKGSVVFAMIFFIEAYLLMCAGADGGLFALYVIWKVVEYWIMIKLMAQFRLVLDGGERIAKGDYAHPIPTAKLMFELQQHAQNLNNVQAGVAAAVEEKMKSERFRTELITNVSHDIKTPLTSIINYVDLIKKEPISDPTMQEYIEVLDRQSTRLKKLIEDLMEASKASTGNLPVNAQVCDATVMLTQIVGEFTERAQKQRLELVVDCPQPPVNIYVDGRHLWRIIDNLMVNICKYAQADTRVYISLERFHGMVIMTFRNISRERLKMDGEELFARFVRGDSSRNTEGSGLGLSIAKSLTDLMKGNLAVQIDGDLFKVILSFEEWKGEENT